MTDVTWNGEGVLDQMPTVAEAELADVPVAEAELAGVRAPARPSASPGEPPAKKGEKRGRWQTVLLAMGSLVFVYGVALGSMYAIGSIVHAIDPGHHFDILYVFHNRIVLLVLIAITALWLVPPYPPAFRKMVRRTDDRPLAMPTGTIGGGGAADGDRSSDARRGIDTLAVPEWSDGGSDPEEGEGGMPTERT